MLSTFTARISRNVCGGLVAAALSVALGAWTYPAAASGEGKTLRSVDFHSPVSVGSLSLVQFNEQGDIVQVKSLGQARGAVRVPFEADKQGKPCLLRLAVNFYGAEHLDFIKQLKADDIDVLDFDNDGRGFDLSDQNLAGLAHLTGLKALGLEESEAATRTMIAVGNLTNLVTLNIGTTLVKSQDLAPLARLKKLHYLELNRNNLDDSAFAPLAGLPDLRKVEANRCGLTAGCTRYLVNARHLMSLSLNDNHVGDAALEALPFLPELVGIDVGDCDLTDRGLVALSKQSNLQLLFASYGHYTQKGFAAVATLPHLQGFYAEGNVVKPADIAVLSKAPRLRTLGISIDPPDREAARKALPRLDLKYIDRHKTTRQTVIDIMR